MNSQIVKTGRAIARRRYSPFIVLTRISLLLGIACITSRAIIVESHSELDVTIPNSLAQTLTLQSAAIVDWIGGFSQDLAINSPLPLQALMDTHDAKATAFIDVADNHDGTSTLFFTDSAQITVGSETLGSHASSSTEGSSFQVQEDMILPYHIKYSRSLVAEGNVWPSLPSTGAGAIAAFFIYDQNNPADWQEFLSIDELLLSGTPSAPDESLESSGEIVLQAGKVYRVNLYSVAEALAHAEQAPENGSPLLPALLFCGSLFAAKTWRRRKSQSTMLVD